MYIFFFSFLNGLLLMFIDLSNVVLVFACFGTLYTWNDTVDIYIF